MRLSKTFNSKKALQVSFRIQNGEIDEIKEFFDIRPFMSYKQIFMEGLRAVRSRQEVFFKK